MSLIPERGVRNISAVTAFEIPSLVLRENKLSLVDSLGSIKSIMQSTKKGFSIIEVLLATFVLSVGLVAVVTLLSSSLSKSFDNRKIITATGLAQEGIELVYHVRDTNYLVPDRAFPTGGASEFPGRVARDFCRLTKAETSFVLSGNGRNCFANSSSPEQRFSLGLVNGYYIGQNTPTQFARVLAIDLDNNADPRSATVSSIVWWGGSNQRPANVFQGGNADQVHLEHCTIANRCVFAQATLTDWK